MKPIKLKQIEFFVDRPPKIVDAVWNADWFLHGEEKDVSKLKKNGWKIPDDLSDVYEVYFSYGYTFERFYTDKDGFLNLTKE